MKVNLFTCFIIAFLFTACHSKSKEEVQYAFEVVKATLKKQRLKAFKTLIDQESKTYLDKIEELAKSENYEEIKALGQTFDCELTTLLIYEQLLQLNQIFQKHSTDEEAKEADLFGHTFTAQSGIGIMRFQGLDRYHFADLESASKAKTVANIKVDTGNGKHFILSKFVFYNEGGDWKLNLMSTFRLDENLLKQQHKRSGNDKVNFIKSYLKNLPGQIEFQYRMNLK